MATNTNPERAIRVYFGQPGSYRPTKDEVGSFLVEEMGLATKDGDPRWSEGIGELIDLGMEAWSGSLTDVSPQATRRVEELEDELEVYRRKVQQLQDKLARREERDGLREPAERVHRAEARILEVVCREENEGAKSMNFVHLDQIAQETGLPHDVVVTYAETLSRPEFGGHLELDDYGKKAKAADRGAFERYCEGAGLDPQRIRGVELEQ